MTGYFFFSFFAAARMARLLKPLSPPFLSTADWMRRAALEVIFDFDFFPKLKVEAILYRAIKMLGALTIG